MKSKIQTNWNFGLFYKSPSDPKIEADYKELENKCENFAKNFREFDLYKSDLSKIKLALEQFELLDAKLSSAKPLLYFNYRKAIDTQDIKNEAEMSKGVDRLTKAQNKVLFFPLLLGKVDTSLQKKYLNEKSLSPFKRFLEILFERAKYELSEKEEKIMNLKSGPSYSLWVQMQEKILYSNTVKFKGKEIPLAEAQFKVHSLKTKDRHGLYKAILEVYKKVSPVAEAEINAIYTNKKINDELRGFLKPESATALDYQNSEEELSRLVDTVTKSFGVSHQFYELKAKLLNIKILSYADRQAKIGEMKSSFSFDNSVSIVQNGFQKADVKFKDIFDSFLRNGQIDVFPQKNKEGGAFCSGSFDNPTFVLLNHVDTLDSLKTLAHEMGHAIHSELSKSQRPLYQGYTTSVAEVASTLFENFAFEEVFEKLSDKEKIVALHDRLQDDISTIFRQIACFNFEKELHERIRKEGAISKEEMAKTLNKHMASYLGPKFKFIEDDGYTFVMWSHIRRFFYVYSYAYGELISKVLYSRYKKDKNYIEKIKGFLSAGSSKSPADIFKEAGIDTTKPDFIKEGISDIEKRIYELEILARKAKLIKP